MTVDLDIVRRDIRLSRQSFDGKEIPLDIVVNIWIDQAEVLVNEISELRTQNWQLRTALETVWSMAKHWAGDETRAVVREALAATEEQQVQNFAGPAPEECCSNYPSCSRTS